MQHLQQSESPQPDAIAPPPLVGVMEAARLLGVERSTVQRWARTGKLPAAQKMPGATGALLFHREDVEALAKAPAA